MIKRSTFDPERFKIGLRSLVESKRYERVLEDSEVFDKALKLYVMGHADIIDNILYACSTCFNS